MGITYWAFANFTRMPDNPANPAKPLIPAKLFLPAKARSLIRRLGLQPHPEGGYYREIHRSAERVETRRGRRAAVTTIYFHLARGQKSVLHRLLSDEIISP